MFIHFCCLCPLDLDFKLNFNKKPELHYTAVSRLDEANFAYHMLDSYSGILCFYGVDSSQIV